MSPNTPNNNNNNINHSNNINFIKPNPTNLIQMTIKRSWVDDRDVENFAMANCLMLLSRVGNPSPTQQDRVFNCKTCNKEFKSFQALGGHRASHKRLKTAEAAENANSPPKPKTHECSVCGLEFAIGQALGGHMRRHRDHPTPGRTVEPARLEPVAEKRGLFMDLNLTPYENDLKVWSSTVNLALAM